MLQRCIAEPCPQIARLVVESSGHRNVQVRRRALAARAALQGPHRRAALEAAARDFDPGIRELAVELARANPEDMAVAMAVLERDAPLATKVLAAKDHHLPLPPATDGHRGARERPALARARRRASVAVIAAQASGDRSRTHDAAKPSSRALAGHESRPNARAAKTLARRSR
jgi:hypothetical protein